MKSGITILAGAMALCGLGSVVAAEATAAPAQESPADKLAALQAQKALNRVRLDIATQEMELAKVRAPAAQPAADPSPLSRPGLTPRKQPQERPEPAAPPTPPPAPEAPRLVSIVGMADKLRATVLTPAGVSVAVSVGEVLEGGWVVRAIDPTTVTLAQGARVVVLKP